MKTYAYKNRVEHNYAHVILINNVIEMNFIHDLRYISDGFCALYSTDCLFYSAGFLTTRRSFLLLIKCRFFYFD